MNKTLSNAGVLSWHLFCGSALAQTQPALSPEHQTAHDIFKQLIEINTTDTPAGNVTTAAEAMADRFRAAGFPAEDIHVDGPVTEQEKSGRPPSRTRRRASPSCFSHIWMWWKRCARIGPWTRSSSMKSMAFFMAAAPRTSSRVTLCWSPISSASRKKAGHTGPRPDHRPYR